MFGSTRDRNAEAQRAQRIHLGISSASLRFKTYAAEPVGLLIDFHEVKSLDGLYRIIHNFSETQCLGVQEIETQRRGGRREFIYASPLRSPRLRVSKPTLPNQLACRLIPMKANWLIVCIESSKTSRRHPDFERKRWKRRDAESAENSSTHLLCALCFSAFQNPRFRTWLRTHAKSLQKPLNPN
jgi:hypothetical protein